MTLTKPRRFSLSTRLRNQQFSLLALIAAVGLATAAGVWYFAQRQTSLGAVRNVVLISIDTCRADRLSGYGYKRKSTPSIDAIASEGALFEQALSPVPLTTPAHSSMLTGTYPPYHGVRLNNGEGLAAANVTLAELLHDAGLQTAAFVGGFPLDVGFHLNQGFDVYDARFTERTEGSPSNTERTAEEVSRPAMAWLEQHAAKPFFLFLHYYDAHLPYTPPPPFGSEYADDLYAGEIAYVDSWIGQVVARLRKLDAYDDTLMIVTADHGESLGEHGERSHGYFVYQGTQHVPLIIRAPHGRVRRPIEARVSLVDIVPTVLDLVGLRIPSPVQGVSLRGLLEGTRSPVRKSPLYCESLQPTQFDCASLAAIVDGPWKFIRAPKPELYDLSHDPAEAQNLADREPAVAERLREKLEASAAEMTAAAPEHGATPADEETVKRLQSLGYVGGGATSSGSEFDPSLEDPKDFAPTFEKLEEANAWFHSNRSADAERQLLAIVEERPSLVAAHEQLAQIARQDRRLADAVSHYDKIVAILGATNKVADLAQAEFALGFALHELGRDGDSIAHYEKSLALDPDQARVHLNLGIVLQVGGKPAEAAKHYEAAIRLQPDTATALNALAWIRATSRDAGLRNGAEAVRLAESACRLTGRKIVAYLGTLAAAYAESQRFDDAVAASREALALARASGDSAVSAQIEARMALYRSHRPYRL